jgi:hypothetical protein
LQLPEAVAYELLRLPRALSRRDIGGKFAKGFPPTCR